MAEAEAEAPFEPSATAIRSNPPLLPRRGEETLRRTTAVAAAEAGADADTDAGSVTAPAGVLGVRGDLGVSASTLGRGLPAELELSCLSRSPSELPRSRERSRSPAESSEPGTTAPAGTTIPGLRGEERCSCHGPFPRAAAGSGGGGGGSLVRVAGGSLICRHGWSCCCVARLNRWRRRKIGYVYCGDGHVRRSVTCWLLHGPRV